MNQRDNPLFRYTPYILARRLKLNYYLVPDGIDDGSVAFQCGENDSVGRHTEKCPQRRTREPYATDELVPGTAWRHTSAIDLDNSRQDREQRCTQVYDALVDDKNVNFLNNSSYSRHQSPQADSNQSEIDIYSNHIEKLAEWPTY